MTLISYASFGEIEKLTPLLPSVSPKTRPEELCFQDCDSKFQITGYFETVFYHRKVRDSDGPDQAIDLDRPTYEEIDEKISKMLFVDGNILRPIDQLKLEVKKLQALNIKGSLKSISLDRK